MNNIFDLIRRILLSNMKKYRLFLICNTFAIAILFSMVSLINNRSLMDFGSIDSIISSNIYAPTALVFIFVGIFVPYTYSLLKKETSKIYGILISIGMSEEEVNVSMLVETLVLAAMSVLGGLLIGNALSVIVYVTVRYGIRIEGLSLEHSLATYKTIILFAGALYAASYVFDVVKRRLSGITDMIISKRKSESGKGVVALFVIGASTVVLSFVLLSVFYGKNSNSSLICFTACILGIVASVGNAQFIFRNNKKKGNRIFPLSDFLYYYKRNVRIVLASFGMFFMILFFMMFTLVTFPNFGNNAKIYNPFHITYSEYPTMERRLTDDDLTEMAQDYKTQITLHEKIDYLYINGIQVFSLSDVNRVLSKDYQVDNGLCISVKCEYLNDGYEHEINNDTGTVKVGNKEFDVKENVYDVLFGKNLLTQGKVLIVSDIDFNGLAENENASVSSLNLLNFADHEKTVGMERRIVKTLADANEGFSGNEIVVSSRALACQNARESSEFLLFLVLYVSILFYISVLIMIHYKFEMEWEEEIHKIRLLQSIGACAAHIDGMLRGKVGLIFIIPFTLASFLTILYGYGTNFTYGYGVIGMLYGMAVSAAWFVIVYVTINVFYKRLRKRCEEA